MKITFVGSHGTGKTTIVNELQNRLKQKGIESVITPEVPRIICDLEQNKHFFRRENNTLLKQVILLFGQAVYENVAERNNTEIVLCDRSVLDHWSYTQFLFPSELEESEITNSAMDFIRQHCISYDYIFYIPVEVPLEDDGTREGDIEFQRNIDEEIFKNLERLELPFEVIKGSTEDRIESVLKIIKI